MHDFSMVIREAIDKCLRIEEVSKALHDIHEWFATFDDDAGPRPQFTQNNFWYNEYLLMQYYIDKTFDLGSIVQKVIQILTPLKVS